MDNRNAGADFLLSRALAQLLRSAARVRRPPLNSAQGGGAQQGGLSSLLSSTDITGATTQTATNADGSTTTTISYVDGTTVSMTTPAASQNSDSSNDQSASGGSIDSSNSNSNLIEELIRLQSQLVAQATSNLSTIA